MRKGIFKGLLAGALSLCLAIVSLLAVSLLKTVAETPNYKYVLAFEDDFNGELSDGWSKITGGSSYVYKTADGSVYSWRFGGQDHIAYKTKTATDYGKFLYGKTTSTNYMFEVKMRADVNETLGEYMSANSSNLASALTLNTHIPFFVTNPSPDANKHTFKGRSVCVSNYAIGFYEYGDTSGWAKSVRLNTKFSEEFDWREWHTIRVEATETECNLWLDGVLILTAAQSEFTRATTASGLCGFAGICNAAYVPLYYDDFRVWTKNETYDPTAMVEKEVSGIDAADFRDTTKIDYQSGSIATGLSETEKNALIYNPDGVFGTDIRLLKEYAYQSFEITAAFDIENQKTAKGVVEGEPFADSQVRTGVAGILFNGSDHNDSATAIDYHGYLLKYHAVYSTSGTALTNNVTIELTKYDGNTTIATIARIGVLSGTTSCIINAKVENGILSVIVYKTAADLENGNKATLASPSTTVTVADGVYSISLPDYDASAGGDYTEGQIGFWCNGGGAATRYVYEAEILSFSGKTLVAPPACQPVEEEAEHTLYVIETANGSVRIDGAEATGEKVVAAHTEAELSVVPAEGYLIDNVKINGISLGGVESFLLSNITKDYEIEVTFTNVRKIDVYVLAGQSNAAGFTPISGLYKAYTYGGAVDESKLSEYESGYTDVLYYGITQTNDPANSAAEWTYVTAGEGATGDRMGAELGFAEIMSGYYGGESGKAAVIKYAVGSTGFQYRSAADGVSGVVNTYGNWISPTAAEKMAAKGETLHAKTGLMYANLLVTFAQGLQSLVEQGYEPAVKGIMWMQGCEDASWEDLAYSYAEHLSDLIADLRRDLTKIMSENALSQDCSSVPFVIGKIGADLQKAEYEDVVREQMQLTAASMQNVRIVETEDFCLPDVNDNNDVWHFSAKDILSLGNRFARILLQETGKEEIIRYGVSFDLNGGVGNVETQSVKQWLTAEEPDLPSRSGYAFDGWFEEGAEKAWNFTANSVGRNLALTAKWTPNEYEISYHLDEGEFTDGSVKSSYTIEDGEYVLPVPVKIGYTFAGWYDNGEFEGEPVSALAAASVGDKDYFAKWSKEISYCDVTVAQSEHGTLTASAGAQTEVGTRVVVTAIPDEGYELGGVTINGVPLVGNEFVLTEDTVIEATFVRNGLMFAITLVQGEHGEISTDKSYAVENDIVTVTATPEKGYKLKAVYVNGTAIEGTSFVVSGDSSVTAEFEPDGAKNSASGCKSSGAFGLLPVLFCAAVLSRKRRGER